MNDSDTTTTQSPAAGIEPLASSPAAEPPAPKHTAKPRFADTRHFGSISDSRWVEDPWGMGFRFKIRRDGCEPYQEWLKEGAASGSKLMERILKGLLTESFATAGRRQRRKGKRSMDRAMVERAIANTKFEAGDLTSQELEEMKPGVAEHLVLDWSGPAEVLEEGTERPLECTHENVLAWMENRQDERGLPHWVPEYSEDGEEIPYGGQPLGDAWADFFLTEAADAQAFHGEVLGEHARGLVPTPDGVLGSGTSSP